MNSVFLSGNRIVAKAYPADSEKATLAPTTLVATIALDMSA